MRRRLLVSAVAVAAALIAPSAALASLDPPVLDAPASPTASSPVTLNWGDVAGETGFRVYRADSDCLTNVTDITALASGDLGTGVLTFPDASPAEGTRCYFVRALAGVTVGPDSNHVLVTYDTVAPTTPVAPGGVSPAAAPPTISIPTTLDAFAPGGSSGVRYYDVYRDGAKVNLAPILEMGNGPYTWTDDGIHSSSPVTASGSFSYRVLAVDAVGHSSALSPAKVIQVDADAPTPPGTPTGSTPVSSAPTITFIPSTDGGGVGVDHYDVYRNGSLTPTGPPVAAGGPYVWTDTGAVASGTYSYTVVAVDNVGNSSLPSPAGVITLDADAPVTPVAPTGATPVASAPSITIIPTSDPSVGGVSTGIDHYDVYRNGSLTPTGPQVPSGGPYSWTDTGAVASGTYSYTVVAVDNVGNASAHSPAHAIVYDVTPPSTPGTPSGLSPVASAPTISFAPSTDANSGVDHYDVYRNGSPTPTGPPVPGTGPFTWSDTATVASGPYSYTVVAVDAVGNPSAHSAAGTIVVDTTLSAPTSVTALATPTTQRPQFSWVAPAAPKFLVDHYKIYRDTVFLADVPSGTVFTDNSVVSPSLPDHTYTYQVRAADLGETKTGVFSAPVSITYDTTPPSAPSAVAATAALDGSIGITWNASSDGTGSGIARYVVRRSLSSTAPVTIADGDATCSGLVSSCQDATTLSGKLYSYAVFAVDAVGISSPAGVALGVTARDQLPPSVPTGLRATPGDASIALQWDAAGAEDDVAGYVLVAKPGSSAPVNEADGTRVCTAIIAGSTTCSATGLTNGATYTFGLFALDEALNRSQPAIVSAAPNGKVPDTKAPAAVSGLKAKVSGHTVTLTWKNPGADFDHVVVTADTRKPASAKAATRVYSGSGTKATAKLASGQSRWFAVVAYDAAGNASAPASVRASVASASPFGPPPHAKVHGNVHLSWPVVKGAKYYNVQIYAGKKRVLVSWPGGRGLVLPKAKLKRGKTYTWYVWPGLGAKAKAHYGKLIGKSTFTFAG
jgi:fibronectin type 3 domain-containing protein